jgi:hypothetical protein
MIKNMKAIEYNTLKTMIQLLIDRLPSIAKEYNIKHNDIPVLPSYPADLTDLKKPSIIVRKVDTDQSKIGFGNVLGQYFNKELGGYVDVMGKRHDMMIQFDVVTSNNSDRLLFESMISDDIFNNIAYNENGRLILYDFTGGNPTSIGQIHLIDDPSIRNLEDGTSNNNYIGCIRHKFSLIQTIIPKQEYVDLSKWIKQTYKIKL